MKSHQVRRETETKLVISDGVVLRCKFIDHTYVPVEMLDVCDVIRSIRASMSEKMSHRRCSSAPTSPQRPSSCDPQAILSSVSPPTAPDYRLRRRNSSPADFLKSHPLNRVRMAEPALASNTTSVCLRMSPQMSKRAGRLNGDSVCAKVHPTQRDFNANNGNNSPRINKPEINREAGLPLFSRTFSEPKEVDLIQATITPDHFASMHTSDEEIDSDISCDSESDDDACPDITELAQKAREAQNKVEDVISCLSNSDDYVHVTSFDNFVQFRCFLEACVSSKRSVALDVLAGHGQTVSVVFQLLDDFKQDFMMLNCNKEYMFFLRPF